MRSSSRGDLAGFRPVADIGIACLPAMPSSTSQTVSRIFKAFLTHAVLPEGNAAIRFVNASLDEPVQQAVLLEEFRASAFGLTGGIRQVWFVVRDDPQSVFYDLQTGSFGACWGPDAATGRYVDLGFRDENPFEMFIA